MGKSLDGVLIKKAHAQTKYTMDEVKHLEACLDPVTGPLYFCTNFLKIQHPTRGAINFEPYEYQERLIKSIINTYCSVDISKVENDKTVFGVYVFNEQTNTSSEAEYIIVDNIDFVYDQPVEDDWGIFEDED